MDNILNYFQKKARTRSRYGQTARRHRLMSPPKSPATGSIPFGQRALMALVIGVSVPEGIALLLGPSDWYPVIWGWTLTPMTARFTAGPPLTVALGFIPPPPGGGRG